MISLRIHRMNATFGKLSQESLELSGGLNILQAPNETGKSTWCAFVLAMLYGINSRERDKAGCIAEKNRFAPWSGAAMSGRLDCAAGGDKLTVTRETKRAAAPLGEFKAVYSGTDNPYPGLTGQTCGETLLGVSREVYARSAFIRQAGLAVTQDAELEKRIAALITTGEEDTSYSEAADALKKQLNRRRHNKTGQLPALELELQDTNRQLSALSDLEFRLTEAGKSAAVLESETTSLTAQLAYHDRWEAAQRRRELEAEAAAAADAAQSAAALRHQAEESHLPENETIARLRGAIVNLETVRKSVNKAMAEKDAAMKAGVKAETAVSDSPFTGKSAEEAKREAETPPTIRASLSPVSVLLTVLALLCMALGILALAGKIGQGFAITGLLPGVFFALCMGSCSALWCNLRRGAARAKSAALTKRYGTSDSAEITALADAYAALCQAREDAQNAVVETTATYNALYASLSSNEQGILLEVRRFAPAAFDIPAADAALRQCAVERRNLSAAETAAREARLRYETLARQLPPEPSSEDNVPITPPERSRSELESALQEANLRLAAARTAADHLSGQISALGDRAALEAQSEQLSVQIETLEVEYAAIRLAMETLDGANTELQNRFSPALGRRTAEIFSALTDGAYTGVVLDRSFHLSAEPAGDPLWRDAQLLSAGACDQLYLAARLAICELALPREDPPPLVLDDALANFDDARMAAALHWLKAESQNRQILLFTCHSREAAFFSGDGEVSTQRLTNRPSGV